jgi:hypothetical protein
MDELRGRVVNSPLRVREVPFSNLDQETGYPEVFRGLRQPLQADAGIVP